MIRLFMFALLFFSSGVFAAGEADINQLTSALQNGINVINTSVLPHTINYGYKLFAIFLGVGFVYYGVQYYASNGSISFVAGDLTNFVLKASIPYLFIIHNAEVTEFISDFFYGFAGLMLNGVEGTGMSTFPLWDLFKMPIETINKVDAAIDANFALLPSIGFLDVGLYFERVIDDLVATVVAGILAGFFAIAMFVMIAQVALGMVLFAISLTFAPLMSVFSIGWIFSGLFKSWLSFMLSSGFVLIVGAILLKAAQAIIVGFGYSDFSFLQVTTTDSGKAKLVYDWFNASIMMLFAIVVWMLARQVQSIAAQIAGGSVPDLLTFASKSKDNVKKK